MKNALAPIFFSITENTKVTKIFVLRNFVVRVRLKADTTYKRKVL